MISMSIEQTLEQFERIFVEANEVVARLRISVSEGIDNYNKDLGNNGNKYCDAYLKNLEEKVAKILKLDKDKQFNLFQESINWRRALSEIGIIEADKDKQKRRELHDLLDLAFDVPGVYKISASETICIPFLEVANKYAIEIQPLQGIFMDFLKKQYKDPKKEFEPNLIEAYKNAMQELAKKYELHLTEDTCYRNYFWLSKEVENSKIKFRVSLPASEKLDRFAEVILDYKENDIEGLGLTFKEGVGDISFRSTRNDEKRMFELALASKKLNHHDIFKNSASYNGVLFQNMPFTMEYSLKVTPDFIWFKDFSKSVNLTADYDPEKGYTFKIKLRIE